jgi:hypothetical protein
MLRPSGRQAASSRFLPGNPPARFSHFAHCHADNEKTGNAGSVLELFYDKTTEEEVI